MSPATSAMALEQFIQQKKKSDVVRLEWAVQVYTGL
jgi:hypothetical protein